MFGVPILLSTRVLLPPVYQFLLANWKTRRFGVPWPRPRPTLTVLCDCSCSSASWQRASSTVVPSSSSSGLLAAARGNADALLSHPLLLHLLLHEIPLRASDGARRSRRRTCGRRTASNGSGAACRTAVPVRVAGVRRRLGARVWGRRTGTEASGAGKEREPRAFERVVGGKGWVWADSCYSLLG